MTLLWTLFSLAAFLIVAGAVVYGRLVKMRDTVRASWSDLDALLLKRHDLAGSLLEAVRGYATRGNSTITGLTETGSAAGRADGPAAKARAESAFQETIRSLLALSESHPQLRADAAFLSLQEQLQETENSIEYARRYYNAVVRDFNTLTESFPSNLIAAQFSFHRESFFELKEPPPREPVKAQFT